MTPGMGAGAGRAGAGGAAVAAALIGTENGFGGVLHFAVAAANPGFCHACWLRPRSKLEAGPCAETMTAAAHSRTVKGRAALMVAGSYRSRVAGVGGRGPP